MFLPLDKPKRLGHNLYMDNMNTATALINGRSVRVLNTLSSGPHAAAHTLELLAGAYVYEVAGIWWLQEQGQHKRAVTVTR